MCKIKYLSIIICGTGLDGFEEIYMTFIENMTPIYNDTCNDFQNKVAEFQNLNQARQEFYSLSSLYAVYLPVHSMCREQFMLQISKFSTLGADKNGGANVCKWLPENAHLIRMTHFERLKFVLYHTHQILKYF